MSHELFENFDLEETNNKSLLKNKRKSDNIKSNVNNKTKDTKSNNDFDNDGCYTKFFITFEVLVKLAGVPNTTM